MNKAPLLILAITTFIALSSTNYAIDCTGTGLVETQRGDFGSGSVIGCQNTFEGCVNADPIEFCCTTSQCVHNFKIGTTDNIQCVDQGDIVNLDNSGTYALCGPDSTWFDGEASSDNCGAFEDNQPTNPRAASYFEFDNTHPGLECCGNAIDGEVVESCETSNANGNCDGNIQGCCPTNQCVDDEGACQPLRSCRPLGATDSYCDENGVWIDPDNDERACNTGNCGPANTATEFGIGGITNQCCGDDERENIKTCLKDTTNPPGGSCGADTKACCSDSNACITEDGTCAPIDICSDFDGSKAFCQAGVWKDPDASAAACQNSGCTGNQGHPDTGRFHFNIGGITNQCCGDDPNEFVTLCKEEDDTGACTNNPPLACCSPNNCVDSNGACVTSGACGLVGTTRSFCEEGEWKDPDTTENFCIAACSPDAQTPITYGVPSNQETCCGDDENEVTHTRQCAPSVCTSDTADRGCCAEPGMCVANGACFAPGELHDVNGGDGDQEICVAGTAGNPGMWEDGDQSADNCAEFPLATFLSQTGTPLLCGRGSCNEVTNNNNEFCCGDDDFEHYLPDKNACIKPTEIDGTATRDCIRNNIYTAEGKFILDDLCENTKFTSRTREVASLLLHIANTSGPRDYALFCDTKENTLNYVDYLIRNVKLNNANGLDVEAHRYLTGNLPNTDNSVCPQSKCTNNFCVLQLGRGEGSQVLFGTSLNLPLEEIITGQPLQQTFPFIQTLEGLGNRCPNAIGKTDDKFHRCKGSSSKVYYNEVSRSIIYSTDEIPSGFVADLQTFEINLFERFLTFLKNPHNSILAFIKSNQLAQENIGIRDTSFLDETNHFSRVYSERRGFKRIKGITEKEPESNLEHISLRYQGFDQNICDTTEEIDKDAKKAGGPFNRVLCDYTQENDTYHVYSDNAIGIGLWEDLTAGLRTTDTGCSANTHGAIENLHIPSVDPSSSIPLIALGIPSTFSAEIEVCQAPYDITWDFIGTEEGTTAGTSITDSTDTNTITTQTKSEQTFLLPGAYTATLTIQSIEDNGQRITRATTTRPFIVRAAPLCEVRNSCQPSENCIMELLQETPTNDHDATINFPCTNTDARKVCCPNFYEHDPDCTQETAIKVVSVDVNPDFVLDAQTDNEGAASDLPESFCLKSTRGITRCNLRHAAIGPEVNDNTGCSIDETCIIKTSNSNQAHFSSCSNDQFKNALCCNIGCGPTSLIGVDLALLGRGPFINEEAIIKASVDACNKEYTYTLTTKQGTTTTLQGTDISSSPQLTAALSFDQTGEHTLTIEITTNEPIPRTATASQTISVLPAEACTVREEDPQGNACAPSENAIFEVSRREDAHIARGISQPFSFKACCPSSLELVPTNSQLCPVETQTLFSLDKAFDSHAWALNAETNQGEAIVPKICIQGAINCRTVNSSNANEQLEPNGCAQQETCIARMAQTEDGHVSECTNPLNTAFPISVCCTTS